jgi:tetratricopeptide (TPR) repeat protein
MLKLADRLLAMGRNFQQLGRDHDALHILSRLSKFRELPEEISEEAQFRLGEIQLRRGKVRRARRYLATALLYRPDSALYHYLLATALDTDDKGDPDRALEHYRKSLELEPDQPRCLSDLGLLSVRQGRTAEGLQALRQAVELAPDDYDVVRQLCEGLRQVGRRDEVRQVLRAARFRNPRDPRFRELWNELQYQQLYDEQEARRREDEDRDGAEEGPMLLPFVRPPAGSAIRSASGKRVRRDPAAPPAPPHLPRLPKRRHAQ